MDFLGKNFFLIGIKGTGLSNLAVILKLAGAFVSGCDIPQRFPTDLLLEKYKIQCSSGFDSALLGSGFDAVIYSSAYAPAKCPVLKKAFELYPDNVLSYPEFIARCSKEIPLYAVSGTHGKTTCASCASWLLKQEGLAFFSFFGSVIKGGGPVFQGTRALLAEACEYQNHFLLYKTCGALLTSVEMDHPDWFKDQEDVFESFLRFVLQIEKDGFLILCSDGPNVKKLARLAKASRPDLKIIETGFSSRGPFGIRRMQEGGLNFQILPYEAFSSPDPEPLIAEDYAASAILASMMILDLKKPRENPFEDEKIARVLKNLLPMIKEFPGTESRSEVVLEENGVLYIDDYAHHPSQIKVCLNNLRKKYPGKRICVAFAPHTYSRTQALMNFFVQALSLADVVAVQKTFPSARFEEEKEDNAKVLASRLENRALSNFNGFLEQAAYMEYDEATASFLAKALSQGGICLALGAGNNRKILSKTARIRRGLV